MSFDDDQASIEDSQPRFGIEVQMPPHPTTPAGGKYRISTGTSDITIGGFVYKAGASKFDELPVPTSTEDNGALKVTLPVRHPLIQRYLAQCIPPKRPLVTLWCKQVRSGQERRIWRGFWTSTSMERHLATMLIPSRMAEILAKRLPTISVGPQCPFTLFGPDCRLNAADFVVNTTVALLDGVSVTAASVGGNPDDWFKFGHIVHPSGEWMTIAKQVGALLSIQYPIWEMAHGDSISLYPGCSHDVTTGCLAKFNNVVNFGGFPDMVSFKPFSPNNHGVWL